MACSRLALVLVAGCGRIGFDPSSVIGNDDGGVGDGDGAVTGACNTIERFADDFEDNTVNSALWTPYADPGTAATEQAGQLVLTLAANSAATYAGHISKHAYDLRGARVVLEYAQLPNAGAEVGMTAQYDDLNGVSIGFEDGMLYASRVLGGSFSEYTRTPFVPANHRFWAIAERAGRLYYEVSADGVTFSPIHDTPAPIELGSVRIHVYAGTFAAVASPGVARLAAVNPGKLMRAGCPVSTLVDDFEDGVASLLWDDAVETCCGLAETGGALALTTNGASGGALRASRAGYDLRGGEITVRVASGPSTSSGFAARLFVFRTDLSEVDLRIDGTMVVARMVIGGTPVNVAVARLGNENFLRIRETAGTLYFETSPDKAAWSIVHEQATPLPVDDVEIRLQGSANTATIPDAIRFDDVNR